jgi:phenylacetic acid degradation operon negative regulatory protein
VASDPDHREIPIASLISFLYGVTGRDVLPGPVLIRLITDLGIADSAARSAIARMRRNGQLAGTRHGRITDYQLIGLAASGFRHARQLGHPGAARPERVWQGEFAGILYGVPERLRRHRDRLRTAALLAGYAPLRPGLLIAVTDGWDTLAPTVASLPAAVTIYPVTLRMKPADAKSAAIEAWNLVRLARHLDDQAGRLKRALRAGPGVRPNGPAALRRLAQLTVPVYRSFIVVPPLPAELLPDDWPQPELVRLLGEVHATFGPPARQYVTTVLD